MPLWKNTTSMLRNWIKTNRYTAEMPLFPNNRGQKMTRSGVNKRLADAVAEATTICPTLKEHQISPHTIRRIRSRHFGLDLMPPVFVYFGHGGLEENHQKIACGIGGAR